MKRKLYKLESLTIPAQNSIDSISLDWWLAELGRSERFFYFTIRAWGSRVNRVSKSKL